MDFTVKTRVFCPGKFEPEEEDKEWKREDQQGIRLDGTGNISVKK